MPAKLLLCEHEEDIIDLLVYNFSKEGFEVLVAADEIKAKELVYAASPDLILIGEIGSSKERANLVQWIRATRGMERSLIIILTTDQLIAGQPIYQSIGVDLFVPTPVRPQILLNQVHSLLSKGTSRSD